jgi:hypothetical protein
LPRKGKASRLRGIWTNMCTRCNNPNSPRYGDYGGRGIVVCEEWRHTFAPFEKWALTNGYTDNLTIDRIDVNGDYCPENCRFVTYTENNQNRRDNVLLEFNGEVHCLTEWSRIMGIGQSVLTNRLKRGWSVEKALTFPVDHRKTRWGKK